MLMLLVLDARWLEAALSSAEHNALVDLYNSTNGASWTNNANWLVAADECTWYNVFCDGAHTTVQTIGLVNNNLSGSLPASLGNLTNLQQLGLASNRLSGSIPPQLGNLTSLVSLVLMYNRLSGSIPPELGSLASLQSINLGGNQLSGIIPPQLANMTSLQYLELWGNQLSGSIPPELGSLASLRSLNLDNNQLSGSIPPQLGSLTSLQQLGLNTNQLSGSIPPQLGSLTSLRYIRLTSNQLSGSIPSALTSLTSLTSGDSDFRFNALYSTDPALTSFLSAKQNGGDWQSTQTIAPTNVSTSGATPTAITVNWTPIAYSGDSGFYQVGYSTTAGGPYTPFAPTTSSKSSSSLTVTGLTTSTTYYFVVSTTTLPHANNKNTVTSGFSAEVSGLTSAVSLPVVNAFTATPSTITAGQTSTLSWTTANATTVSISGVAGTQPANGSVSVSPPATTTYILTATGPGGTATATAMVTVTSCPSITLSPSTLPNGTVGTAYSQTITAGGGAAPYTFTIASGSFPSWLTINVAGTLSGTPTMVGSFGFAVTATDSAGCSGSQSYTIVIQGPPMVTSFAATPSTITAGQTSTLSWTTTNAAAVSISGVAGTQPANGSVSVSPPATTTYTLTATGPGGTATATVMVVVNPATGPVIVSFTASPSTISPGQSSTLSWTTTNATSVSIDNGVGSQAVNGSVPVSPVGTTTYVLTASGAGGLSATGSATVTVTTPGKLQILLPGEAAAPLTASGKTGSPRPQIAGTPFNVIVNLVDVNWNVINTAIDMVAITSSDPAASLPPMSGLSAGCRTFAVTLNTSGSQTLTATDLSDSTTAAALSGTVTVLPKNAPVIAVASLPAGMISSPNTGGAVDSYTLVNTGGSATTISLTQSENFFSQAPTSFTLGPGQSQQITITAAAEPARLEPYTGSSIPSGEGVPSGLSIPIRLLVVSPPAGEPNVRPTAVRIDTSDEVTTGTAAFHNGGTAAAIGIFVADVPWLMPQSAPLTIAVGATETGTFAIDRSKRPDADALLGSQTARLTFVYFTGSGASLGESATVLTTAPPVGTSIVTLVDTAGVKRGTSQGIPPLGSGEVGRFIAGLPHKLGSIADVFMVNAGASALPASLLYFVPSGVSSLFAQIASVSQLSSNSPVGLGDVVSTVFKNDAATGSLQLRSRTSDLLAVGAMLSNQTSQRRLGTALSVFRSDQVAAAGQDSYLAGVRKDATTHTDLYIQETAGNLASIQIDFFDAGGASVSPGRATDSVPGFGQLELLNVVPAGAVVARITNTAGSNGKVVAEAHVVEDGGDVWNIVDSTRQGGWSRSEPVVVPFAAKLRSGSGAYTATDLVITNTSAATATGTLAVPSAWSRRRVVRTSAEGASGGQPLGSTQQSLSFAPHQTRMLADVLKNSVVPGDGRTYLTFTPASGEFVVASRTYSSVPGQSWTVGSSVPGIALSSAMKSGDSRHIAGVEDASPKAVAAAATGTIRTSVGLLETSGKEVTVRLAIRFMYALQLTTQLLPPVSAEFALKANQLLIIDDLARSIIGSQRDQYGDLHNIQLDVQVVSGGGAVIPFTLRTDNGSGDVSFVPIP